MPEPSHADILDRVDQIERTLHYHKRTDAATLEAQARSIDAQTTRLEEQGRTLGRIETCLVGKPTDVPPVPGLVDRMAAQEEFTRAATYWFRRTFWLAVVAVAGLLGSLFWDVIKAAIADGTAG